MLECCAISICRIVLKLPNLDGTRKRSVAQILFDLLETDDVYVLENTINAARALAERGSCFSEILSDEMILRVATTGLKYKERIVISSQCCCLLAVFSFDNLSHNALSSPEVMKIFDVMARAEDMSCRELTAVCLCNVSTYYYARERLIEHGVITLLTELSCATNETIQHLCARCVCNLTVTEDHQKQLIDEKVLEMIHMICQVRSVAAETKRLCARALLNLLTPQNMPYAIEGGVIRAFATIASSSAVTVPTLHLCARALLIFSATNEGCLEVGQRRLIMNHLFTLVNCESMKTKVIIGKAACNLLACKETRLNTIRAGGLQVLKIICTLNNEDLLVITMQTIISLSRDENIQLQLVNEPLVPMIVLVLQKSSSWAFECALQAAACLSVNPIFRKSLVEKGYIGASMCSSLAGKINDDVLSEACSRTLYYLSYAHDHIEAMVHDNYIVCLLQSLCIYLNDNHPSEGCQNQGMSVECGTLVAITLRNLSFKVSVCKAIVEQKGK